MDAARKFVDKGQIDKAVKEYLRIVHEDPKDVRVWLKIGDLYAKKGSKQDAIETYGKVARFYHEQGFFLKAVAVYKQILKLDPRLVDVILKLAELYRQLGLMSDAMQHFESVAAHFHREGNTKEALATVQKLVDLDPENIATRIKLAELYSKEGLVAEAATEFSVACEQLRRQGRQDDFIKVAERLLWHKPDNHALNRELAGLYLRRNDPRRALQKLQACFKADPRDVETLGLLAQAFQALDQKAKTVSVLKELARVHIENKQRDRASEVYRKILEFVPSDNDALQFLGPAAAAAAAAQRPAPPSAPSGPPASRSSTQIPHPSAQMPAQVRASSADAKFGITGDLPSFKPSGPSMTGAMPLLDDQSLSGVDFALPDYVDDDGDFSADMEPAPDPRQMSAAGERHADEIAKILAETDVYVKYGLHQKAIDHLQRVFALDPENVEAHERIKDIFVSQGREQDAEVELLKLAELVASSDPDRAEKYLRDLLAMNSSHTGAFDLARRFRLRVARMSSASDVEFQISSSPTTGVDVDIDDLDLVPQPRAVGRTRKRDSIDDFDPDELIGPSRVAAGSPAARLPQPPPYEQPSDSFDLDFGPSTGQMSPEQVDALNQIPDLEDSIDQITEAPAHWSGRPGTRNAHADRALGDAVDQQLDDDDELDGDLADELAQPADEDLPFDPDDARSFDRAVASRTPQPGMEPTFVTNVTGFEDTRTAGSATSQAAYDDALPVAGSYDPFGTEAVQPSAYDPSVHSVDTSIGAVDLASAPPPRAESLVEDELDEADFYAGQGMYSEAMDILRGLLQRYPQHRLIQTKIRDLESLAAGESPLDEGADSIDADAAAESTGTDALDLDEIEEFNSDDLEEEADGAGAPKKRRPTVMLQKPVDESDADTHYDLGLAYKEMGLHDEAIKAFEKVLRSPQREVQCRLMIGMCQRDMNNPTEAIQQFKQGLHAGASERERQSLYYEIGITYEAIGDFNEALYYFEMVTKRDPNFADAGARASALRNRGTRSSDDDL
ncbi:MAG TPA: tetratricopeptide repeat protein [Kofleriaceae bacterium]|nr:tetratricopeptide repeat protein [Kofleriaceae bacterium]